ncbi:T9SS type A sorting domain-containing protein [Niastella sp. OAS944]|uniref:T9SS type A sorting domain-containing protein n=1 Tax=Niastella sp. OAS944 TaxID=2664089 RepID=UPI0034907ADA|nr:putative repeat protein (TIGR01451 family) [Chitinophagaceae bacterium OAS944]
MNFKFYPLRALLFTLLLFGFKANLQAQADFLFTKGAFNNSSGSGGATALVGNLITYTIRITNQTTQNFVASKLYDNIPYGVAYMPGTTTLNGAGVPDVSGKMPYAGSGGYINSPTYGIGILAPGAEAIVTFQVKVTANGGKIFNNATIDATQNGVATIQATNTVETTVTVDAACNVIYQVTTVNPDPYFTDGTNQDPYSYLRTVNVTPPVNNIPPGSLLATGVNGGEPQYTLPDTINNVKHFGAGGSGTKIDFLKGCAAIAYDRDSNRIYFVNNTLSNNNDNPVPNKPYLSYYDRDTDKFYRTNQFLTTNNSSGYNVNRMGKGSDGYFYALTSNARELIRFSISPGNIFTIDPPIALSNATTNGSRDIFSEGGGDLFADGSGKLYMIANSNNMYKINPVTRVAHFMGTVSNGPNASWPDYEYSQSLAIDANGNVYINGNFRDIYKVNLQTMVASKINSTSQYVYTSGDYSACGFPVLASSIIADKSYKNINGSTTVNGGDTVVYTITVENIGNVNAAGVYMYDYIPPSTVYLPGTTKMNGVAVADVAGVMPFAVSGGRLVKTQGEDDGIVKPGAANRAVVTFNVVTEPNKQVCNQSRITLLDADGNVMFVNSSDPTNVGQTPTCFYSDGVLPLQNLKLKGSLNGDRSVLNWSMIGDDNIAYYDIEYSENGSAFKFMAKVAGKGLNSSTNTYQYTDVEHTFAPLRHYRLKVVEKSGNFSYSGLVTLSLTDVEVAAKPNPFDRSINVRISLKTNEQVRIRLLDVVGRQVYSTTENLTMGVNSILINLPTSLKKGMYVLDVKAGEQSFQKKLLKQ